VESTLFGREDVQEEEANRKDSSAADDLRELAAKGVCAPLWRTNLPVQPVCIHLAPLMYLSCFAR